MISNVNPWLNMKESSQRRIESITNHNLFWITDLEGKYGFCLQSRNPFTSIRSPANLNGVSILKRNSVYNYGELFLILNNKEDWQIFHSLCEDLISITHKYGNDEAMIGAVEIRLKRWQQLLKQDRNQDMSLERQMGLFSELLCLKDIVTPKVGLEQAIISWVGADFDKQDFLLDNAIIEVKSYRTTKSPLINISSLQQLHSDKEPIYLLTYSLMQSDNGVSVDSLVNEIEILLEDEPKELQNVFDNKLLEYGFIPEIVKTPFFKFLVDKNRAFFVSDKFPKILPSHVKSQITKVKYTIDLLQCSEFEIEIDSMI
ncbi:MAG: PD-(D/E)XK motif protein [Sulfurovaceae bacterium]|nr:PD-(D/E)XK motif protein [Sulfurovaceae bacterium]